MAEENGAGGKRSQIFLKLPVKVLRLRPHQIQFQVARKFCQEFFQEEKELRWRPCWKLGLQSKKDQSEGEKDEKKLHRMKKVPVLKTFSRELNFLSPPVLFGSRLANAVS